MSLSVSEPTNVVSLQTQERQTPPVKTSEEGTAAGKSPPPSADWADSVTLSSEAQTVRELQARDREVRAHEAAHAAAGGSHAGSPSYSFQKGPDGRSYAVGGEVQIDTSKEAGDPQATLEKAETIRAAALAPAQPSSADRAIAAKAAVMAAEARAELAAETEKQITAHLSGTPYSSSGTDNAAGSLLDKYA